MGLAEYCFARAVSHDTVELSRSREGAAGIAAVRAVAQVLRGRQQATLQGHDRWTFRGRHGVLTRLLASRLFMQPQESMKTELDLCMR